MKPAYRTAIYVLLVVTGVSLYYGFTLGSEDKRAFMPAKLSYSHHQIELACSSCHGAAFSSKDEVEKRCRNCHADELVAMEDSHGSKKFGDPRNAKWLQVMDAKKCLSCHQEHVPERTSAMTLSQPKDFCIACHADVANDRPDHKDIDPSTCTNAGCHRYHDNRALNEDFIAAHLNQTDTTTGTHRPIRTKLAKKKLVADMAVDDKHRSVLGEWATSSHANGHANCSDCHQQGKSWSVDMSVCKHCHEDSFNQWTQGHHGMKFATLNSTITVKDSALPMQQSASDKAMNCNSCHQPHQYNTIKAESESCLGCHADEHSLAWKQSKHAELWRANADTGASCATCHMPHLIDSEKQVTVQHNISAMMRPQEKMLQQVCMTCHGYEFSLRALSSTELIRNNFSGLPSPTHQSVDWVKARKLSESKTVEQKK
ncbi:MAG TPA: cytochrome c3 family protein [Steroidobacteraceae bacterium]|nr:cytochrome c3 family protein [Steroidobacteraceae bacterium]